jgi:glutamate-1-semialdehyde 2,1-aminomutase
LTVPYNDLASVQLLFEQYGKEIAAVIVEPVAGNMGMVLPVTGFLEGLREITQAYGTVLIFDEVMTGFRVSYGGAQARFGIKPDLTTLGKVIGGGLPVGAYGGQEEMMRSVAPTGPVYQAGTLSGNPLAMAAGLATIQLLNEEGVYERLERMTQRLASGFLTAGTDLGIHVQASAIGAMFGTFFARDPVTDFDSAQKADRLLYQHYFHAMLDEEVYLAPSSLESGFVSIMHTDQDIDETVQAMRRSMHRALAEM